RQQVRTVDCAKHELPVPGLTKWSFDPSFSFVISAQPRADHCAKLHGLTPSDRWYPYVPQQNTAFLLWDRTFDWEQRQNPLADNYMRPSTTDRAASYANNNSSVASQSHLPADEIHAPMRCRLSCPPRRPSSPPEHCCVVLRPILLSGHYNWETVSTRQTALHRKQTKS